MLLLRTLLAPPPLPFSDPPPGSAGLRFPTRGPGATAVFLEAGRSAICGASLPAGTGASAWAAPSPIWLVARGVGLTIETRFPGLPAASHSPTSLLAQEEEEGPSTGSSPFLKMLTGFGEGRPAALARSLVPPNMAWDPSSSMAAPVRGRLPERPVAVESTSAACGGRVVKVEG